MFNIISNNGEIADATFLMIDHNEFKIGIKFEPIADTKLFNESPTPSPNIEDKEFDMIGPTLFIIPGIIFITLGITFFTIPIIVLSISGTFESCFSITGYNFFNPAIASFPIPSITFSITGSRLSMYV